MKKIAFVLMTLFAILLVQNLQSCSQDDTDDPVKTKAALLLAKSKEFAEKYGVSMELNRDSVEVAAQTLTVEQMEEDYRRFAALNVQMKGLDSSSRIKTRNKLRVRKLSADFEETQVTGSFDFEDLDTKIKGSCSYTIGNLGSGTARVTIKEDEERTCSSTFLVTGATTYGNQSGYNFTIGGTIYSSYKYYKIEYWVNITCQDGNNTVHVTSRVIEDK